MLKNIKQDIKNIILLLFIVGILSLIIYISVYSSKEYTKNVNLDIETYNYKKSEYVNKHESIKINSEIPINDYIVDLKFDGNKLIAISNSIYENKSEIKIYEIDPDDNTIDNIKSLSEDYDIVYNTGSISPSRDLIVYDTLDYKNTNKKQDVSSIIYNMEDNSKINLGYYFELLRWLPDSSGFYGIKKGQLFEYSIDEGKIIKTYDLKNQSYISKIEFSQDATKMYTMSVPKSEICIYNLNNNTMKSIADIKYIYDFEVIDDQHLIIEGINDSEKHLYLYNLENGTKEIIKGIHLDEMHLSRDKSKLITVYYTGNNESTIDVYDINSYNKKVDFAKLGTIPMIKGIPYVDISDGNKLAYSIQGDNYDESKIYVYDIINKK